MVNYIEILRLKKEGYSLRQIQSSVHSTWQTVRDTINKAEKLNLTYPLDTALTNEVLELILFPGKHTINSDFLEPDFEHIHTELAKAGVTLTLMWEEYRHKTESFGKRAYMPTQFGDKYRAWAKITKATMRIHHKPGDAIEIDWAGQTLPIYDSITGETTPAYLFIAVLPCSGYAYAEVTSDMALENWLGCHINAFEYFGGVSRLLIPDNLKTGVTYPPNNSVTITMAKEVLQ